MSDGVVPVGGGTSYSGFFVAAAVGGVVMAAVSGVGSFLMEEKVPVPKTIARDFILGAVLLLLIMQLLPESTQKLIGYVTAMAAVPVATAAAAATEAISEVAAAVPAVAALTDSGAPEVKVGVPRF